MEIARMDYRFTAILIILLCLMTFFLKPAHARNDYLNNGTNTCSTGDVSVSIEQRDSESRYRHNNADNNYDSPSDDRSVRLTWRKYLGSACTDDFKRVQQENMELKQQLELMKMCGKVNNNPTLQRNPSFALLVAKCSGIIIPENKKPDGSYWDDLKDDYKKENPDIKLMGDSQLLMPKNINDEDIILPLPKPANDEAEWNAID
tara:strand:+ start:14 stop:625 length:612 start_codon:yes stop_codon:yes gene_type:complete